MKNVRKTITLIENVEINYCDIKTENDWENHINWWYYCEKLFRNFEKYI